MGLDITITERAKNVCPHCGGFIGNFDIYSVDSGGREWYPILEEFGYYVPYEKRTEEDDWYGKDMELTEEQAKALRDFVKANRDLYFAAEISNMIATALMDGNTVVINADW